MSSEIKIFSCAILLVTLIILLINKDVLCNKENENNVKSDTTTTTTIDSTKHTVKIDETRDSLKPTNTIANPKIKWRTKIIKSLEDSLKYIQLYSNDSLRIAEKERFLDSLIQIYYSLLYEAAYNDSIRIYNQEYIDSTNKFTVQIIDSVLGKLLSQNVKVNGEFWSTHQRDSTTITNTTEEKKLKLGLMMELITDRSLNGSVLLMHKKKIYLVGYNPFNKVYSIGGGITF